MDAGTSCREWVRRLAPLGSARGLNQDQIAAPPLPMHPGQPADDEDPAQARGPAGGLPRGQIENLMDIHVARRRLEPPDDLSTENG